MLIMCKVNKFLGKTESKTVKIGVDIVARTLITGLCPALVRGVFEAHAVVIDTLLTRL